MQSVRALGFEAPPPWQGRASGDMDLSVGGGTEAAPAPSGTSAKKERAATPAQGRLGGGRGRDQQATKLRVLPEAGEIGVLGHELKVMVA